YATALPRRAARPLVACRSTGRRTPGGGGATERPCGFGIFARRRRAIAMKHTVSLLIQLALAWWVLSGQASAMLLLGLASVLFVGWLERRLARACGETHPLEPGWRLLGFWAWLLREIVVANLQVARLVLARRPALSPRVLRVPAGQSSDLERVILGNAITLTPGTVTLDLDGDTLLVHALTEASAADVEAGGMARRVPRAAPEEPRA